MTRALHPCALETTASVTPNTGRIPEPPVPISGLMIIIIQIPSLLHPRLNCVMRWLNSNPPRPLPPPGCHLFEAHQGGRGRPTPTAAGCLTICRVTRTMTCAVSEAAGAAASSQHRRPYCCWSHPVVVVMCGAARGVAQAGCWLLRFWVLGPKP